MLVLVYRHSPETSRSASRLSGQAGGKCHWARHSTQRLLRRWPDVAARIVYLRYERRLRMHSRSSGPGGKTGALARYSGVFTGGGRCGRDGSILVVVRTPREKNTVMSDLSLCLLLGSCESSAAFSCRHRLRSVCPGPEFALGALPLYRGQISAVKGYCKNTAGKCHAIYCI